ncbi:hypothetical protein ACFL30_03455 [Candidatus Latescibacterota bacterium]
MTVPFFSKPKTIEIPDIENWQALDNVTVSKTHFGRNGLVVEGNDGQFSYQIMSPPIRLGYLPHVYKFRIHIEVHQGTICLGVINNSMNRWLIKSAGIKDEYCFSSIFNRSVYIIITNIYPKPDGNPPSRFTIYKPE